MKARELLNIGFKQGPIIGMLLDACANCGFVSNERRNTVLRLYEKPEDFLSDPHFCSAAKELISLRSPPYEFVEKPFRSWGEIDENTNEQMANCMRLPIVAGGALMPDAHLGYGLSIGGVLATRDAVIPYAVGVDIACRMKLSVLPIEIDRDTILSPKHNPIDVLEGEFVQTIEQNTRFGLGASFVKPREHGVLDRDWNITSITKTLKDTAAQQLGTSGGGNHFVDICEITFEREFRGIKPGTYVAIMTHSGSRGPGSKVAAHYSKLAQSLHRHLPAQYKFLAWLDMNKEGAEYWAAMELMGEFASANHYVIHASILKDLGVEPLLQVENHHNFAWKEMHNGEELIIHRKGATPAGEGVLGIIPGSMSAPGFLVEGKGNAESFCSASHGAGRAMSRTKAKESFRWNNVRNELNRKRVRLLSAGIDESPGAYKDIFQVMDAQSDLVDRVATIHPRIVKMSGDGESED